LPADHGLGGRNQEFALAAGLFLNAKQAGEGRWLVLSAGTDGEDGPTDAAGAVVDPATFSQASSLGPAPAAALRRPDAHPFLDASGSLLRTGLTGTNVMDVRLFLLR